MTRKIFLDSAYSFKFLYCEIITAEWEKKNKIKKTKTDNNNNKQTVCLKKKKKEEKKREYKTESFFSYFLPQAKWFVWPKSDEENK